MMALLRRFSLILLKFMVRFGLVLRLGFRVSIRVRFIFRGRVRVRVKVGLH